LNGEARQKLVNQRAGRPMRFALARGLVLAASLGLAQFAAPAALWAEDAPTFSIEFHDGKIAPLRLEVPANKRFRIELHNTGVTAAEFESTDLHLEKVLAPNNPNPPPVLVIHSLDPGQYVFFDDLHPDAPKILLVAK
jgi:hypothetical protein